MIRKNILATIINISESLENIPEVESFCKWAKSNTEELSKIIDSYIELIGHLDNYNDNDIQIIKQANELVRKRKVPDTSASHITTEDFLESLDDENRNSLRKIAIAAFDPKSYLYAESLNQLSDMMYQGHKMFSEEKKPKDGDSLSDSVIWGHTQMSDDIEPNVVANFIITHYVIRFFTNRLSKFGVLKGKDDFFIPMMNVILLEESRNPSSIPMFSIWLASRKENGLGWINHGQIKAYQDSLIQ